MNLKTRIRSAGMRYFSSAAFQEKRRSKARKRREQRGEPPIVHYFHQVDDPYSHLAVQKLDQLNATYDLAFEPHLVSKPAAAYRGSVDHFDQWALGDAAAIAADYDTHFAPVGDPPQPSACALANQVLSAHLTQTSFATAAFEVGEALWTGRPITATGSQQAAERAVADGDALRAALGHYQGAMFHFDGEWYWGIDRIRLLEARLIDEGYGPQSSTASPAFCVPEPTPQDTRDVDAREVQLDYFPSLRSPYTAIGHQRVLELIERSGVRVNVRPVMPMLMRGIPAPRAKQNYIITDAGREARVRQRPFGRIVDPFGAPVKKAFALFPGAQKLGADMAYVTAYLDAAWFDGVDITTTRGLKQVAANAGLDWVALTNATQATDWEAHLSANLRDMLTLNLWGVPSFCVTGGNTNEAFACWGQDRIWRVENEIAKRAAGGTLSG